MRCGFIHIPKNGGTCLHGLMKDYSDYFLYQSHDLKSSHTESPICIIRDPYDRFLSAYQYWRNGPENGPHVNKFRVQKNLDLNEFINRIQEDKKILNTAITWHVHFLPQCNWLSEKDYHKAIIINYQSDLSESIQKLFDYLKIPHNGINLPKINVTKSKDTQLTEYAKCYIEATYREDFELINKIKNEPELFRKVI
jgi:hypothetical protein